MGNVLLIKFLCRAKAFNQKMKALFVASYNKGFFSPFIVEQAQALEKAGCQVQFYGVVGHGIIGYLQLLKDLKLKIKQFQPDIIHAHYGLCGLLACLQRQRPVVVTFHGSDINQSNVFRYSKLAMHLDKWNIFVSEANMKKAGLKHKCSLIPCGIDLTDLQLTTRSQAREKLNIKKDNKLVLFSGAFDNKVKNSPLAFQTINLLGESVELKELKGYNREQVTLLMCAADALLMTSFTEGSPQVVKEAMACSCPIVSVDVGDVKERINGVEHCYIAQNHDAQELADLLKKALSAPKRTNGRDKIIADGLDNVTVSEKIINIYKTITNVNC